MTIAYNTAVSVYRVEITSGNWRSRIGNWFGGIAWNMGVLSLGLIVYLVPDMCNLELLIGLSAIPFLPLWFLLPESPRWLITQGRIPEAKKVMTIICKWNKKPLEPINHLEEMNLAEEKRGTIRDLFKYPATRRNTICMFICWVAFSMGYFGLMYNTPPFDWNIYLVFVFPVLFTTPLSILIPFVENRLGRKPVLTFCLLMAGLLLMLTMVVPKGTIVIVIAWIGTIACGTAFGVGYVYCNDLFPTSLRTTALGLSSAGARIGALLSPLIAMLDTVSSVLPLAIYGLVVLFAGIVSIWLWPETKRTKLMETLEEAEEMANSKNSWTHCSCCKTSRIDQ